MSKSLLSIWLATALLGQYVSYLPMQKNVIPYCSAVGYPAAPVATSSSGSVLGVWYKADSFSPCSATSESSWTDSSGNANTATFTSGTFTCNSNQLNGHNGLALSGTTQATITLTSASYNTAFVVFQGPVTWNTALCYAFFGSTTQGQFEYGICGGPTMLQKVLQEGTALVLAGTTVVSPSPAWHQINWNGRLAGGSSAFLRIDRTADATTAFSNVTGNDRLFVNAHNGGDYGAGMTIAEMFLYQGVSTSGLSSTEMTQNECYIYGKYGI